MDKIEITQDRFGKWVVLEFPVSEAWYFANRLGHDFRWRRRPEHEYNQVEFEFDTKEAAELHLAKYLLMGDSYGN